MRRTAGLMQGGNYVTSAEARKLLEKEEVYGCRCLAVQIQSAPERLLKQS
jgi:hypothetical protein